MFMENKTKKFRVFESEKGSLEYIITVSIVDENTEWPCTRYTLFYSDNSEWTDPGEEILSIIDTQNGMEISKSHAKEELDYSQFVELMILINFINKSDEYLSCKYYMIPEQSMKDLVQRNMGLEALR